MESSGFGSMRFLIKWERRGQSSPVGKEASQAHQLKTPWDSLSLQAKEIGEAAGNGGLGKGKSKSQVLKTMLFTSRHKKRACTS